MKRKRKKINIIVYDCCADCPYVIYDPDYGMSYDSGYDCGHPDTEVGRIVNDWDVKNSNNKNPKGWPSIPENCPLEDVEGDEEDE